MPFGSEFVGNHPCTALNSDSGGAASDDVEGEHEVGEEAQSQSKGQNDMIDQFMENPKAV